MSFFDLFKEKKSTAHTFNERNLMSPYTSKIDDLKFKFSEQCKKPSEKLINKFEKNYGLNLPEDYRLFLLENAGKSGSAVCPFKEPTPMGAEALINNFYGFSSHSYEDIFEMTKLIDGYPVVIALGSNDMGAMFWYICQGARAGQVVMHDGDGRASWTDERFFKMFSNLAPEIKEYLELRKEGKLPPKEEGFEHIYLLADSFSEFIENLQLIEKDFDEDLADLIIDNEYSSIEKLLTDGLDPNKKVLFANKEVPLLEIAVMSNQLDVIRLLFKYGAELGSALSRSEKYIANGNEKQRITAGLLKELWSVE